jgi:hypothetical protein
MVAREALADQSLRLSGVNSGIMGSMITCGSRITAVLAGLVVLLAPFVADVHTHAAAQLAGHPTPCAAAPRVRQGLIVNSSSRPR